MYFEIYLFIYFIFRQTGALIIIEACFRHGIKIKKSFNFDNLAMFSCNYEFKSHNSDFLFSNLVKKKKKKVARF